MKKNFLFALAVLAAAGVLALWGLFSRGRGAVAYVDIVGAPAQTLPLDTDGVYHIDDAKLPVTLEVAGGRVRFVDSRCPDHVCEGFGWLAKEQDQAICLPAGVVVTVERENG